MHALVVAVKNIKNVAVNNIMELPEILGSSILIRKENEDREKEKNMNLTELYRIQSQLDERISREHGLEHKDLVPFKLLALQVELGELANETRCFKFWSNKGPSSKDVILEEYVDCLHFILSIGLDLSLTHIQIERITNDATLAEEFQNLFTYIASFKEEYTMDHYRRIWNHFLLLGRKLDFTEEEIFESYLEKNKVNHKRQDEGY